jgi:hypothetical protein
MQRRRRTKRCSQLRKAPFNAQIQHLLAVFDAALHVFLLLVLQRRDVWLGRGAARNIFDRRNLTSLRAVWEDRKWIGKV